ncbi:MAG: polyprenyl synthetase family protein [Zoogloeaceae bacterium]|jgi:farnesyl diphosphate synthase|nr:polyprenyl synthetase family protein [Zoogloeaceae bacterium]
MSSEAGRDFQHWMRQIQTSTETALSACLPVETSIPARLHTAMRHAVLGGGKRVRPLLVHAAGELTGAPSGTRTRAACAVELIHAYSLVHDDLPCMDNDALRRGKPTCHIAFDEATALLAGDALQTQAFFVLSHFPPEDAPEPRQQLRMLALLAEASGSLGMAGGQAIDLAAVGKSLEQPELELMHALKTGALIRAAILLGALCGPPLAEVEEVALDRFAKRVGLLFQVVDDILDASASTATLGKTAGKDAASVKPTYVSLLGLSGARDYADALRRDTLDALSCFAERARRLIELADFICRRNF